MNVSDPFTIVTPCASAITSKPPGAMADGIVENVNVAPPSEVTSGEVASELLVNVEKSVGRPTVVAVGELFDVIVQLMAL